MMKDEDKATSTIAQSPTQKLLVKVDKRDKLVRTIEIAMLLVFGVFSVFLAIRLQFVIDQNQRDSLRRSHQAQIDRSETKDYIKCILLIKYDTPAEQLTSREGTEKALDLCANSTER